jgi:hypothetical protein
MDAACPPHVPAASGAPLERRKSGVVTRESRLSEFNEGPPRPNEPLQVLCEDHNGTYVLPYPCQWCEGRWQNCATGVVIEATVVGWRIDQHGTGGRSRTPVQPVNE